MRRTRMESDGMRWTSLSPLHRAAQLHRTPFVEKLLDEGADVNSTDRVDGTPLAVTPLALAVRFQPQIDDPPGDPRSRTSLEADRLATVLILLRRGANPFWRIPEVAEAVPKGRGGASDNLTEFILTNALPDTLRSPNGDSLIHWSTKACATNALEILLARGVIPDRTNNFGQTPLHTLALTPAPKERAMPEAGHLYVFEFRDRFYATRAAIARRLLEVGLRHDLFSASGLGDTNALSTLLATNGTRINERDRLGNTPLHWAVRSGAWSATRLLLARGADTTITNLAGDTPLHLVLGAEDERTTWIKTYHAPEIVAELLTAPVPLEYVNLHGLTPLAVAAQRRQIEFAKLLLAQGARVNPTNPIAHAPLFLAAEGGSKDLINLLLDHGADPKARDSRGRPVLHILLEHAPGLEVIEDLVSSHRLSIHDRDTHGDTLLHLAMASPRKVKIYTPPANLMQIAGQRFKPVEQALQKLEEKQVLEASPSPRPVSVVWFLLRIGSDPNAKNNLGETPLHLLGRDDPDLAREGSQPLTEEERKPFKDELTAIQLLLKAGAKLNIRDHRGETPITRAIRLKRTKWAAILRELGARD